METACRLRVVVIVLTVAVPMFGVDLCANMSYQNRNQVDYGPLAIKHVRGKAIDPDGVPVADVCVGLFKESDHTLVAATATSKDGEFVLADPVPGNYRLVATYEAFGAANARVRIGRGRSGVLLRMRPRAIDTTSYVELKPNVAGLNPASR